MERLCPYCGGLLTYIHERHNELEYPVYEKPYWECFDCGAIIYEEDIEGDYYYED